MENENKKIINLNSKNANTIKYDSIIAITIAEGGAMGDPNGIDIVLKDMTRYYFNLIVTDININDFYNNNPVFKSIKCSLGNIIQLDENWNWFDMGFGNYLIIRKEYFEKYNKILFKKIGKKYNTGELYNSWYEILNEAIKDK